MFAVFDDVCNLGVALATRTWLGETDLHIEDAVRVLLYRKEELAQLVGVSPHQLDSLAKKYNVAPFWKQCGGKRTETLRITLTQEEKHRIAKAASIHGNGQTAVFAREVLLREVNQILKNDGNCR